MKGSHDVNQYAVRRVNPFLGVLQVVETLGGRALSTNGVTWRIELLAERHGGWGSLEKHNATMAFYRYGVWSQADGLVCLPRSPQMNHAALAEQAERLIACVRCATEDLPFALRDDRELWLFDEREHKPLALLATAITENNAAQCKPTYWSACTRKSGPADQERFPESRKLEERVKRRAGFNSYKRWVVRDAAGGGTIAGEYEGIESEQFPVFLLREDWENDEDEAMLRAYFNWIAPALLTLQQLSDADRMRLEPHLLGRSISIEYHWRLFPKIIDQNILTVARTQSLLQHSL